MRIYIGNLPWTTSESELKQLFVQYGNVSYCRIVVDTETGRPRGFGFVEMSKEDAPKAIEALNATNFNGRSLRINEAKPRSENAGFNRPRKGGNFRRDRQPRQQDNFDQHQ